MNLEDVGPQNAAELTMHISRILDRTENEATEEILWEKARSLLSITPEILIEAYNVDKKLFDTIMNGIMMYAYIGVGLRLLKKLENTKDSSLEKGPQNGLNG